MKHRLLTMTGLIALHGMLPAVSGELIKPAEYLAAQEAPDFREGHTLPPLTRYGWTLAFDARVELARRWGYALEFGGYVTENFLAVSRALGLSREDLYRLSKNAFDASFLKPTEKQHLIAELDAYMAADRASS